MNHSLSHSVLVLVKVQTASHTFECWCNPFRLILFYFIAMVIHRDSCNCNIIRIHKRITSCHDLYSY